MQTIGTQRISKERRHGDNIPFLKRLALRKQTLPPLSLHSASSGLRAPATSGAETSLVQLWALSSSGLPGWACPPTWLPLSPQFWGHQIHTLLWSLTWSVACYHHLLSVVGWLVSANSTLGRMQDLHSARCCLAALNRMVSSVLLFPVTVLPCPIPIQNKGSEKPQT